MSDGERIDLSIIWTFIDTFERYARGQGNHEIDFGAGRAAIEKRAAAVWQDRM